MLWIPFWAAGIINGVGHALGYRNYEVKDESRNISPIAIWLGGEELHNNHHADPKSARFAARWFEFDVGWLYIRMLQFLRLAKVDYARGTKLFAVRRLRPTARRWLALCFFVIPSEARNLAPVAPDRRPRDAV